MSLTYFLLNKLKFKDLISYIISQFAGGFFGAFVVWTTCLGGEKLDYSVTYPTFKYNETDSQNFVNACLVEFFGTFTLMFIAICTLLDQRITKPVYGLSIGLTLGIFIYAFGEISGAA